MTVDKLTSAVGHASAELRRTIDAWTLSMPRWEALSDFLEGLLAVKSHPVAVSYAHWLLPERTLPIAGHVTSRTQWAALTAFLALILLLIVENDVRRRPAGLFFRAGYARYRPVSVIGARLRPTGRLFFRTKRALCGLVDTVDDKPHPAIRPAIEAAPKLGPEPARPIEASSGFEPALA